MPDAQGRFKGMAVPADAWERVFGKDDDIPEPNPYGCPHCIDAPDDGPCAGCPLDID